jgi:hypothetical protein
MVSGIYHFKNFTLTNACSRTRQSRAADASVRRHGRLTDDSTGSYASQVSPLDPTSRVQESRHV